MLPNWPDELIDAATSSGDHGPRSGGCTASKSVLNAVGRQSGAFVGYSSPRPPRNTAGCTPSAPAMSTMAWQVGLSFTPSRSCEM